MTAQPTLFDQALTELDDPVRSSDPDTSAIAAESVRDTAGNDRLAIVDALHRLGGRATTDQLQAELRRQGRTRDRNVVASRLSQLQKARYGARVEDTGQRATKGNGRPVIVWQVRR